VKGYKKTRTVEYADRSGKRREGQGSEITVKTRGEHEGTRGDRVERPVTRQGEAIAHSKEPAATKEKSRSQPIQT
jgi:hypothetical protein